MKLIALLIGWSLDLILGDPAWLPHPVVGFGKMIAFGEHHLNKGGRRKLKGAVMTIFLDSIVFLFTWVLFYFLPPLGRVGVGSLLIFYCLAGTTLIREVREVFRAVDRSLDEGRRQVARIVGRDTSELSAQEVRTAALETLAENLSDGVVAPLFWLAVGGVPAMLTYKMINTQDSMIGYRTERYKDFGCWAARIDDVANYIPARLTALLMLLPRLISIDVHGGSKFFTFHFSLSSIASDECMLRPTAAIPRRHWLAFSIAVSEARTTISENSSTNPISVRTTVPSLLPTCRRPYASIARQKCWPYYLC